MFLRKTLILKFNLRLFAKFKFKEVTVPAFKNGVRHAVGDTVRVWFVPLQLEGTPEMEALG